MTSYPKPNYSNVFNPVDYLTTPEEIEQDNINNEPDDFNHDIFVNKNGDTMSGILNIPQLNFTDTTTQNTAFTNTIKNNVASNTSKLSNVTVFAGVLLFNIIGAKEVILIDSNNGNNQKITYLDKIQIDSNTNKILTLENSVDSNTINIDSNTNKILTLENSIDDNGEQNISHSSNIGINGTNINTLSKSIHNNSIHIYKNVIKCNDLLNRTSIISTDVLNNTNEIQQTKTDLLNVNNEINDNKIKTLENEQQININTTNITNIMPVGTILITAIPPTIAPSVGYLYCDGASVSISTYGNLYAILGNTYKYNKQEYSGYFYLPDMRQLFVRGSQQNETYPVNAQSVPMGTYQGQSIQTHSHNFEKSGNESAGSGGLGSITVGSNSYTATKTSDMFDHVNNQIYPSAAETRPESISMNYMIKY